MCLNIYQVQRYHIPYMILYRTPAVVIKNAHIDTGSISYQPPGFLLMCQSQPGFLRSFSRQGFCIVGVLLLYGTGKRDISKKQGNQVEDRQACIDRNTRNPAADTPRLKDCCRTHPPQNKKPNLGRFFCFISRVLYGMSCSIKNILRTSAASETNFGSILIFASCVVGT